MDCIRELIHLPRRTKAEIERAKKKAIAARKYWLRTRHRMSLEEYDLIKRYQGGKCAICCRSNGATKALAVDHDHAVTKSTCEHPEKESCEQCWRGLLCGPCNDMLGWARDDPKVFERAIQYLRYPPARPIVINGWTTTSRIGGQWIGCST